MDRAIYPDESYGSETLGRWGRREETALICTLVNPNPMTTVDPSKAALLHESLNDQVMAWDSELAGDWRASANPHPEGVHWDGYIFDAWGTVILPAGAEALALSGSALK